MFISALCPFLAELEPRETPVVLDLHFSWPSFQGKHSGRVLMEDSARYV